VTVTPRDDLHTALRRLTALNLDEVPVVDPDDPARLLGLLGRRELIAVYTREIEALRAPGATAAGEGGAAPGG
jgi:CIC family chloride channel protein